MSKKILFKINDNEVLVTSENKIIIFDNKKLIENLNSKNITVEIKSGETYSTEELKNLYVKFHVLVGTDTDNNEKRYITEQYRFENGEVQVDRLNMNFNHNFYLYFNESILFNNTDQIGGTCNNIFKQLVYPHEEFYNLLMNESQINKSNEKKLVKYADNYLKIIKNNLQNNTNIINFLIETQNDNDNDDNEELNLKQFLVKFKRVFIETQNDDDDNE